MYNLPAATRIVGGVKGGHEYSYANGFPVGPSSGLNFAASVMAAQRLGEGAQVVTVFPDRMERYFSTELFASVRS